MAATDRGGRRRVRVTSDLWWVFFLPHFLSLVFSFRRPATNNDGEAVFRHTAAEVNGKVRTFMVFLSYVLLGVDFLTLSFSFLVGFSLLTVGFIFPASSSTAEAASDAYKLVKLR